MPGKPIILFSGNDSLFQVLGVQRADTLAFLNAATVQVTLFQSDGVTSLSGQSWPLTLPYVSSSNGNYQGTIPAAVVYVGRQGVASVTINGGAGLTAAFLEPYIVETRQSL